jgi:hypothetical protein
VVPQPPVLHGLQGHRGQRRGEQEAQKVVHAAT